MPRATGIASEFLGADVDALYAEVQYKRAEIVTPPRLRTYGMTKLEVRRFDSYVPFSGKDLQATGGA